MNNKIKKSLIIALVGSLLLTGCTKTMVDDNKKAIINSETGQNLTSNIICLPEEESLLELYKNNESHMTVELDKLHTCSKMKIYEKNAYDGLWVQLFVRPLAWLIIKVGKLVKNYGISVMLIGLLIRLILLPFSAKTATQSQKMKEIQPKLQKIEKKYAGKDDKSLASQICLWNKQSSFCYCSASKLE